MLSAFENSGRFFRGNLHTHSTLSDGMLSPEEVCRRYEAVGYDFICLSDHFLDKYNFPIADTVPHRSSKFTTILGAEVHAGEMNEGEIWHILAVGLPKGFKTTESHESGPELAQRCAEAGAFVAIAHPQWYGLMPHEGRLIEAAHAVEIYNHSCAVHTARPDGAYLLDALLSEGKKLSAIATDDAHFPIEGLEDQDAFGGWVMVKANENTPETLLAALKSGSFYSSTGPELHSIILDGTNLHVESSDVMNIMAVGRASRSVNSIGSALTSVTLDVSKFVGDWFRVVIVDRASRQAWSNPMWLEAA